MNMKRLNLLLKLLLLTIVPLQTISQQVPDSSFVFPIKKTKYLINNGPTILIDQAHHNFHTRKGGFSPFSKLLTEDGYRVSDLEKPVISTEKLENCKILVIANAINAQNSEKWILPTPSAFSETEIEIINNWVRKGGSLLLIADHMPFAGAAFELGKSFGFDFINGFAFTRVQSWPPSVFSVKNNTLLKTPITEGTKDYERIDSVATFTGSAFKAPDGAMPVLVFLDENYSLQPDTAWCFNKAPKINLEGYCQGAIRTFGKGRVAVFGEAAMFTAQIVNGNFKVGFNSETAPQNAQFILNLIHWLDNK